MRSFICGLFVISCCALYINGDDEDITPIPNSYRALPLYRNLARATAINCNTASKGKWICHDCRTLQKCSDADDSVATNTVTCGDQFQGKPYCNSSDQGDDPSQKCTANPVACEEATNFICPGKKLYPSLTNCREYYRCTAANANGEKFICKSNSVFNFEKRDCITNAVCYTVTQECGNKNRQIPYKPSPNLYVQCTTGGPPVLQECENSQFGFKQNLLKCDYECKAEGKFGDPTKADGEQKSYYECVRNRSGGYDMYEVKCNGEDVFDKELKGCFPK